MDLELSPEVSEDLEPVFVSRQKSQRFGIKPSTHLNTTPPLPDLGRAYPRLDPIDLNQGVSPRDVNVLATSLAIGPVTPAVTQTNVETPQETPAATTEQEEYVPPSKTAKSMLDHQWLLLKQARQAGNKPMMRTAINQAISTQELLTSLVGHKEMIRLSVVNPQTSVQPHHAPHQFQQGNNPTNNPAQAPRTRQPIPEITFLGRTHSVTQEPLLTPPPPQIQLPTTHQHINPKPINNRSTPSTPILTFLVSNRMDTAAAEDGDKPIRP
ncbi:hypothetical protein PSHT_03726 [Puccinia striiformis]|uniref:Uncharacterized protein n=1 Tax=Puccinia striiformis TaxID=27350 RepID=A0A2S4WEL8_9BASI|nr:hypothetical protein PSHT_03726 [Puccinia striiformis]